MEKGRTEQIIEKLIDSVENGQSVPFGAGKVAVNKDETIMMLRELESIVNGELRVYREFNDRKGKIINDAKKEAEEIIYEAEQTASRIRVTKRMSTIGTAFKAESLDAEEKQALRTAHDIYAASLIYTDEMLTEVNDVVAQAYDQVVNQYGRMISTLQEKAELIAKNKAELMGSLKELSKEDRYTQILELGQLLSYELYNERMKARAMEEDGSYQMEMMFEEQLAATQQNTVQNNQRTQIVNQSQVEAKPQQAEMQASVQGNAQEDSAFANVQQEVPVDSVFVTAPQVAQADSAFATASPAPQVDSAFATTSQTAQVDSAFATAPQIAQVDSAFVSAQQETPVDSVFATAPQVDSAFASAQQEIPVDSAFAQPQQVAAQQTTASQQIAATQMATPQQATATQMVTPQQTVAQPQVASTAGSAATAQPTAKHIPDEEHSIEAVSKTLEMFKNYRPGSNKK